MCGDDPVDEITRKWNELVPSILHLGGVEVPDVKTEKDYLNAWHINNVDMSI